MKTIFYYYYLFAASSPRDSFHVATATGIFSFAVALYVIGILRYWMSVQGAPWFPSLEVYVAIIILAYIFTWLYFHKKAKRIIAAKPMLLGSHWISMAVAILFFAIAFFWGLAPGR